MNIIKNPVFVVSCERISKRSSYYVWFQPNDQLLTRIKELDNNERKWNDVKKCWEVSASGLLKVIKRYKGSSKIRFDFGSDEARRQFIIKIKKIEEKELEKRKKIEELIAIKEKWSNFKEELENAYGDYSEIVHQNLKPDVKLYPHQIVATMFTHTVRNTLLALDMGTGKSLISIAYVEMNDFSKVIVVTPNSLKFNYYNEVEKFTNSKAYVVNWNKNKYTPQESKYIILNYEFFSSSSIKKFKNKWNKLKIDKIDCVISDECHRLKSTKSNTYKNFTKIFKEKIFLNNKVSKVFMSGTPAPSRAAELYSVLHQISPLEFKTKNEFLKYYCGMEYDAENGWGWVIDDQNTRFEELFKKLSPFTYRKRKFEVLKDLPEKTYQKIILELSPEEQNIYDDLEEGVANEFYGQDISNPLAIMGRLREFTSHLKAKYVTEIVDSVIDAGEKIVLIDYYKKNLSELNNIYPKISALHTGEYNEFERSEVVKKFQDENSDIKIFLGTEATTKEGLTLTAASKVGMLTMPWTPGTLDQCTDRLARIGQKNAVNAFLFIFKDTIDEYIFNLIENKRAEISQVIDGEKYESDINQSIINDLIKIIKDKHSKK